MVDKTWTALVETESANTNPQKSRPKLTLDGQIAHMRDVKGIKFNVVNEERAAQFLSTNNYYFSLCL